MHYIYILKCNNGGFYIGCTNDLRDRMRHHGKGYVKATKNMLPVKLYFYSCFLNKYTAYNFEKYLKSGFGRAFMNKHLIK